MARAILTKFVYFLFILSIPFAVSAHTLPDIISLPTGFQPEGVVTGKHHSAYVGSLKNGGIYKVDLVSGNGEMLVEGSEGKSAVGLAFDKRSDYLFVAGGLTGTIAVYDTSDGSLVREFAAAAAGGFVNDGIVTRKAAYFTDSFLPVIYKVKLNHHGHIKEDSEVKTIALSDDFEYLDGEFNANGIVATHHGKRLIIINSTTGALYKVNPKNGKAKEISVVGGELINGDGMLLDGDDLYIVQNFLNQIAVVELSSDNLSAVVEEYITHPSFQIPTTVAGFGDWLYVVNAKFDVAPPPLPGFPPADPSTEFELIRIEK